MNIPGNPVWAMFNDSGDLHYIRLHYSETTGPHKYQSHGYVEQREGWPSGMRFYLYIHGKVLPAEFVQGTQVADLRMGMDIIEHIVEQRGGFA